MKGERKKDMGTYLFGWGRVFGRIIVIVSTTGDLGLLVHRARLRGASEK